MASTDSEFVKAASLSELQAEGRKLVNRNGQAIALFYHEGAVHAVDNRCPHMGFPLTQGTVDEGVLTCHWHHARFELSCGDTFDPFADDVPTYPVEVRDGDVYVRPTPIRDAPPEEHWTARLRVGLEENLRLVLAKSVIGLDDAGALAEKPFRIGVEFGTDYRAAGWGPGLTILAAMQNVLPALREDDRRRALYTGLRHVASDCAGEPPKFDQPSFAVRDVGAARLKEWFRENVEVRDRDGAERTLRTAIETLPQEAVAEIVFSAATDHRYLDAGHTFDFANKAFETLDHVGFECADQVLPSLVAGLTTATRSEELSSWRQPVDLAAILETTYGDLPDYVADGEGETWTEPDGFVDTLLEDDPHAVVDALVEAVRHGATTEQLAAAVAHAAVVRVAQFSTANEFSDWNTVHHTFTYANAVHRATRRTDAWELYRGVFDGATSVYLDRFLNTPPAQIPAGDTDADPDACLSALLDAFDEEGEVDTTGRLVADYLAAGGDVAALQATLGEALLREDANFHTLQSLEAGFSQLALTDDPARRRTVLVAVARYMSAHFPTRREAEQTFRIADRLHRGEKIHEA